MINIQGSAYLDTNPKLVWVHLFDVNFLRNLIPGCTKLERINQNEYTGQIQVGVSAVKGIYETQMTVIPDDLLYVCELKGEAVGQTGTIQGNGSLQLKEVQEGTQIIYNAQAMISGALAILNPRFIESVVNTLIKQGIGKLNQQIRANIQE